ncbi:sensor histidine kinase [Rheinheimera maricola]|uniref:histidine kinase n=1 Tax=Rheinheimera maricola TaxID=2793282 RepID=A0ABS7X4W7_9GAMM|nr:sensor histidine kinase [Rheinheimera maricola]MBZ9610583.1 hypothetical protein [Rheinheimera maricola]
MSFITRCFIFLFSLCFSVSAEQIFSRFGVDDGLPNATIYSIQQDKTGFLWLGSTNSGLLRFDGYRFTEFPVLTAKELEQQQTADVGVILLDDNDNLWAGTWGFGVSMLQAKTGKLRRYTTSEQLAGNQIQALLQDAHRHIWVGTTTGLSRITPDGEVQTIGEAGLRIWSLAEFADGTIWVGSSAGLQSWHPNTGFSELVQLVPGADSLSRDNEIRALKAIGDELWVGSRSGLYRYNTRQQTFKPVVLALGGQTEPIINILTTDTDDSSLLIGSYSGLFRVDLTQHNAQRPPQPALLPNVNVRSILQDRSNVLWLGSRESGLYRSVVSSKAFDSLPLFSEALAQRDAFSVTAVLQWQQQLWLGSIDSVYLIDLNDGKYQQFSTGSRVNAIKATSAGDVYIASDNGLLRYAGDSTLQPVDEPFELSGVVNRNVRDLVIDQNDNLYLGMWGEGVIAWSWRSGTTKHWLPQLAEQAAGNTVQGVFLGSDSQLWVGTRYSGLYQIDLATDMVTRHSTSQDSVIRLPHNDVQCVSEYAGELAVCSRNGLLLYDLKTGLQQHLTSEDGLPANAVLDVVQQQNGRLWVATAKGLGFRPQQHKHVVPYNSSDGMISSELNANAAFAADRIYFGAIAGLVVVTPEQLIVNTVVPAPVLSALVIDRQVAQVKPHQKLWPDIRLMSGQRTLNFEFSALDYQDPARNRFQYKLEGIDADWITTSSQNSAYYANLPVGRYQLWLKASNNHGFYSEATAVATLQVLPHWWQQNWLIYSAIAIFAVLLWLMHQYRLRHIRQINRLLQDTVDNKAKAQLVLETRVTERTRALEESSVTLSLRTLQLERSLDDLAKSNAELKRLDKLKDEFIATVSHELRTPLTAIRGAIGLITQQVVTPGTELYQNMLQTAQTNSERLAHLINDLLDLQKFTTGTFSLSLLPSDLVLLAQQAVLAMQPYASRYQVELQLINKVENKVWVKADSLRIRQVMDNLISNAVKFSAANSTVFVRISQNADALLFEVQDFGVGIPEEFKSRIFEKFSQADGSDSRAKDGSGLGLAICKKIIENHQGHIGFSSSSGQGATFWFKLQLDKTTTLHS